MLGSIMLICDPSRGVHLPRWRMSVDQSHPYFTNGQGSPKVPLLRKFFSEAMKCRLQDLSLKIYRQNDERGTKSLF